MARRTLRSAAQLVQSAGRGKDTVLAHIMPEEAALLKALGGRGSRNPKTGLLEFEAPDADSGVSTGGMSGMGTDADSTENDNQGNAGNSANDGDPAGYGDMTGVNAVNEGFNDANGYSDDSVTDMIGNFFGYRKNRSVAYAPKSFSPTSFFSSPAMTVAGMLAPQPFGLAIGLTSGFMTGNPVGATLGAVGGLGRGGFSLAAGALSGINSLSSLADDELGIGPGSIDDALGTSNGLASRSKSSGSTTSKGSGSLGGDNESASRALASKNNTPTPIAAALAEEPYSYTPRVFSQLNVRRAGLRRIA